MTVGTEPTYTQVELEAMTKAELLELADGLGVDGVSGSNLKAEIIAAIMEAV